MVSSTCFSYPLFFPTKIAAGPNVEANRITSLSIRGTNKELHKQRVVSTAVLLRSNWSFGRGSQLTVRTNFAPNYVSYKKGSQLQASWLTNSQIASSVFTLGTAAVLPFYTLMVLAPKAELTKKCMESSIPYIVLGVLYTYLLYLSWTPDTIRYMFSSKYLLPELSGMAKMFSSEMTLASAWIHLLVIDLFAARHVFHDGLRNQIETRHSVSLCLLFCPIGIFSHFLTKSLTKNIRDTDHGM